MKRWIPSSIIIFVSLIIIVSTYFIYSTIYQIFIKKEVRIVAVLKSMGPIPKFWEIVKSGIYAASKEFDVKVDVVGPYREEDIDVQIQLLEEAINKKPDAIVLAACDYYKLIPAIKKLSNKKTKLVTIDSGIDSDIPVSFIATDNMEAGALAADKLAELINKNGKIGMIIHDKTSQTGIERRDGFLKQIKNYPNIHVIGPVYGAGDPEKSARLIKEMFDANPDIKGIFAGNEGSAIGAGIAIKNTQKKDQIMLVGFDSDIDEIKLIEEGIIKATIVQKPFNMGYLGIKIAVDSIKGQNVEKKIDTGSKIITKENMYTQENQKLLFPFVDYNY